MVPALSTAIAGTAAALGRLARGETRRDKRLARSLLFCAGWLGFISVLRMM